MDEAALKAEWQDFAKRLPLVGMTIFGGTSIKVTEQGSADVRIVGLMLLVRTLSNLKAAIALTEAGLIVEAKVIAPGAVSKRRRPLEFPRRFAMIAGFRCSPPPKKAMLAPPKDASA
jgi:hypothetical protein